MSRRRKVKGYFKVGASDPKPLIVRLKRRVSFGESDVMGIAWHGNYPTYFEMGSAELGRRCGLSYREYYEADLRAPIVQLHIDYHMPLQLDEEFTIEASLIWNEGARINTEYALVKQNGRTAATGYTVQMFIAGATGEPFMIGPELWEKCRRRWLAGEFKDLT